MKLEDIKISTIDFRVGRHVEFVPFYFIGHDEEISYGYELHDGQYGLHFDRKLVGITWDGTHYQHTPPDEQEIIDKFVGSEMFKWHKKVMEAYCILSNAELTKPDKQCVVCGKQLCQIEVKFDLGNNPVCDEHYPEEAWYELREQFLF
jgi:hypothetical protein